MTNHSNTSRTAFVVLAAAAALACASAPRRAAADPRNPRPDWVDNHSMEYPREKFVTGVGAADDRQTAEERSRGEIAKVFSSNIMVDTTVSETEDNANQGGAATKASFSQSVSQNVRTTSKKVLEGVSVVENWQDPATKVYYALAVLDRSKARAALADKLGGIDSQVLQLKQQLDSGDRLSKARAGMRTLRLLKARTELNNELRVVDETGQGLKAAYEETSIKPAAAKAVAALEVAVEMSGDGAPEVETGIVSGLNAFGIQALKGSKGDADLGVLGSVETKAMQGDGSRWQWARTTVTLALKDPKTGKVVSQFDASDREASADYNEAARRSRVELAKRVSDKLSAAITQYFEQ
jgi:hypothetical protein